MLHYFHSEDSPTTKKPPHNTINMLILAQTLTDTGKTACIV